MKRMLSLVALVSVAALAGPLKVGGDVSGALFIPSFDPSDGVTAKIGFGGKIAPAVEYGFNDQFSVRGNVGYEYATYGAEMDLGPFGTMKADYTSQFLTIDLAAQYAFVPQFFGAVGVGYDVNLSTKAEVGGESQDAKGTKNPFVASVGLGYKVAPDFAITAGYRFPITTVAESDNSDGSTDKLKLQTITLGVRYDMGL